MFAIFEIFGQQKLKRCMPNHGQFSLRWIKSKKVIDLQSNLTHYISRIEFISPIDELPFYLILSMNQ